MHQWLNQNVTQTPGFQLYTIIATNPKQHGRNQLVAYNDGNWKHRERFISVFSSRCKSHRHSDCERICLHILELVSRSLSESGSQAKNMKNMCDEWHCAHEIVSFIFIL